LIALCKRREDDDLFMEERGRRERTAVSHSTSRRPLHLEVKGWEDGERAQKCGQRQSHRSVLLGPHQERRSARHLPAMRRTPGTDRQQNGTLKDTQGMLRHASIKTTGDVYVQTIEHRVPAAVNSRTCRCPVPGRQGQCRRRSVCGFNPACHPVARQRCSATGRCRKRVWE
jgi:hypothetical protein